MIVLLRRIVSADATVRAGGTNRELVGNELFGKTLGVIGCGKIGLQVARLGNAFGCHVLGFEPRVLRKFAKEEKNRTLNETDLWTLSFLLPQPSVMFACSTSLRASPGPASSVAFAATRLEQHRCMAASILSPEP